MKIAFRLLGPRRLIAPVGIALLAGLAFAAGAQSEPPLTYSLAAQPGDLTVDQVPGPGPAKKYSEDFTLTITNTSDTDYEGEAPTCQLLDVEIFREVASGDKSVWKWSNGMMFCQMVTPVVIPAGLSWQGKATWSFMATDVKDGKYKAVATFIPSSTTTAKLFEIKTTH